MSRLLPEILLAARLMEARDTLRNLWRDKYAEKIAPWRKAVRQLADALECSPMAVPVRLPEAERERLDGFPMIAMLAAALDETERAA